MTLKNNDLTPEEHAQKSASLLSYYHDHSAYNLFSDKGGKYAGELYQRLFSVLSRPAFIQPQLIRYLGDMVKTAAFGINYGKKAYPDIRSREGVLLALDEHVKTFTDHYIQCLDVKEAEIAAIAKDKSQNMSSVLWLMELVEAPKGLPGNKANQSRLGSFVMNHPALFGFETMDQSQQTRSASEFFKLAQSLGAKQECCDPETGLISMKTSDGNNSYLVKLGKSGNVNIALNYSFYGRTTNDVTYELRKGLQEPGEMDMFFGNRGLTEVVNAVQQFSGIVSQHHQRHYS